MTNPPPIQKTEDALALTRRSRDIRTTGNRSRLKMLLARLTLLVAILGTWQLSANYGWTNKLFTSSPKDVGAFLLAGAMDGSLWWPIAYTMTESLLAFAIGGALGVVIGALLATFKSLDDLTRPFITALNSLPRIALAPLFTLWFGIGMVSKVALGVSLAVVIVLITTQQAMLSVEEELLKASRALGATRTQQYIHVLLPGSVPGILGGLRLGMIYSLLGVVSGEMIAAKEGIGQEIVALSNLYRMDGVLGLLLMLAIVSLVINETMQFIESRLSIWRND